MMEPPTAALDRLHFAAHSGGSVPHPSTHVLRKLATSASLGESFKAGQPSEKSFEPTQPPEVRQLLRKS
jgi:hypothetical protein